jgi:hypothetical protein
MIALTANTGTGGSSDGNVDSVSVIDLTEPVHVIDHITVPDSPEGLAISPKGNIAVTVDAYARQCPLMTQSGCSIACGKETDRARMYCFRAT